MQTDYLLNIGMTFIGLYHTLEYIAKSFFCETVVKYWV